MIIVIAGATATGKSSLAIEVAKRLNGEIVSADSMQVYRGMDIGTAKVGKSERELIPHHLIDAVDPESEFSVADYVNLAEERIAEIEKRGKIAIVCGGTGLYIRALLYPFDFGNAEKDEKLRNELIETANRFGNRAVHEKLALLNPEKSKQIHENNLKRVIRAIEIELNGKKEESKTENRAPKRKFLYFVLKSDRELLYERINNRVDSMIAEGLKEEVERLLKNGIDYSMQSMQGIGYKEWKALTDGSATLNEVVESIKKNSRNYAKRQETWFKKESGTLPLNASKPTEELAEKVCECYENYIKLEYSKQELQGNEN